MTEPKPNPHKHCTKRLLVMAVLISVWLFGGCCKPKDTANERALKAQVVYYQSQYQKARAEAEKSQRQLDSLKSYNHTHIQPKYETIATKPVPSVDSLQRYFAGYRSPFIK